MGTAPLKIQQTPHLSKLARAKVITASNAVVFMCAKYMSGNASYDGFRSGAMKSKYETRGII